MNLLTLMTMWEPGQKTWLNLCLKLNSQSFRGLFENIPSLRSRGYILCEIWTFK